LFGKEKKGAREKPSTASENILEAANVRQIPFLCQSVSLFKLPWLFMTCFCCGFLFFFTDWRIIASPPLKLHIFHLGTGPFLFSFLLLLIIIIISFLFLIANHYLLSPE
jgi:hypothetical protein